MSTITRIKAEHVFSYTTFEIDVPPGGAVIEGGNAEGKTSILKLIRAALVEKGCSKDMIRKGAIKGEIQITVDGYTATRVMHGGDKFRQTLKVTDERGHVVPEPATFLKNLLGISPIDAIALFTEDDKTKRRAKILSAVPCTVTEDQLAAWCPPGADLSELVGGDGYGQLAIDDHGLEVIGRAYKAVYAKRTEANRLVKERQAAADQAIAKEKAAYDALAAYRVQNALPEKAPELEQAQRALDEAKRAEMALDQQARAAEQSAKVQARTREKVDDLRRRASDTRTNAPIAPTSTEMETAWGNVERAAAHVSTAQAMVNEIKARLAEAEAVLQSMRSERDAYKAQYEKLQAQQDRANAAVETVADLEGQALELEQALGALPSAPSEGQRAEAERKARQAAALVEFAKKSAELATHAEAVDNARRLLRSAQENAAALDKSVKDLADDAPTALLAAADGIRGLTIDGDDIYLDGVSLDQLSGQERLFFAVEVAKRLNAKSKLLCVDGLEALDRKHREAFIEMARKDGYQLIATRVIEDGGEPVAKPIHPSA